MTKRYWLHMGKVSNCQKAGVKLLPFSMDSITLTDRTAVAEAHGSKALFSVSTATPSGQSQHCTKNHMLTEMRMSRLMPSEDSGTVRLFLLRQQY